MASNLRRKLKKSYSIIKSSLEKKGTTDWLTDNFYLIDKHYRSIIKNRDSLECGAMYDLLKRYCEETAYQPSAGELITFLKAEERELGYRELCSVAALLSACAINKIGEALSDSSNTALLPSAVKMLFSLSDPQYTDILPAVWSPEKYISRFEEKYDEFDMATKSRYREFVARYAEKNSCDESTAVKKLLKLAEEQGCPLGTLIFRPNRSLAAVWIITSVSIFTALMLLSLCLIGWISLLLAVPLCITASTISDQIISCFASAYRAPRLELTNVPDDAKTLVTVAALLTGGKGDDRVFESLKRFRYMNPDENIYFCLLADLPDSDRRFCLDDSRITENAIKRIDELNRLHGDRFCMLMRERVLNKSENRYGGWERKRGAVCELVSHIVRGDKSEYFGGDFIRDIKYILTLDSDTNLSVGSVREMLSIALHPVNIPKVADGKVISGYGIIQPSVRTELSSAYRTGFSRLVSGAGGADIYATAEFRRSQSLFGSGSFCGKGLVDVALFDSLLCNRLPEGRILSHDVIEGSVLRTLCASDITLTDSTPGNTVSFFRRQHRWLRGDFQNLYFLKGKLLDRFSKLRIFATALRHTSPLFSVAAITVGAFFADTSGLWLFLFAYSELFFPCVITLVRFLFSGSPFACMRFFSKACSLLTQTFARLVFELSSSARRAMLVLHAYMLAATRMITHKKTLEWTTAAQSEKLSSSLGKYVLDSIFSVLLGLALLVFAMPPFIKFCGLIYFVYPLISAVVSRNIDGGAESRPALSEKQKKMLAAHVSDMFRFYSENVGEQTNFLPPDNIQLSPVGSVAMRTSPTNIGFYLVSLLAARDLGLISTKILCEKLSDSLEVIERLEKYKGNLYNWYDISNLSVIGDKYVSTVDSGNFVVMLIALKEGLKEYSTEESALDTLAMRCEKLVNETDMIPFYDARRELFRIGMRADTEKLDTGCYDLLISEARMTAYYAVAASIVPKKHWQSLGRTLTHQSGYIGMMSWSGTAFEYLMPQLFLPLYRDSFLYESVAFSLMVQRNANSLWGISESGYYSFDSEMNYQYKANGIQQLALRRIASNEKVISPYSTYLSLCALDASAIKNLEALENRGMYGKYGLYEALDLNNESGGLCVKSYMAHHVGMSIIACLNAIKDNIFVRRFMADDRMGSANELLQEKIPIDAHVFGDNFVSGAEQKRKYVLQSERNENSDPHDPRVAMLARGEMSALISSNGHISLQSGERLLTNTEFDQYSLRFTLGMIFSRGGRHFGCIPLCSGQGGYGFEYGCESVSHIASGKDFSGRVRYSFNANCNCFVINTRAESLKKYDITLVFEPVLDTKKNFRSHISFSRLFIESEYDRTKRILYFHRRSRIDGKHIFTLAVAPRDKDMSCSFLTSRESFAAGSVNSIFDYADAETDNKTGACIDPLCLIRALDADGGRSTFLITCGETKNECERNIRIARGNKTDFRSPERDELFERILPSLLYNKSVSVVENFNSCGIGDLWSKSISGDHPLVVALVSQKALLRTESILRAFLALNRVCIRIELIFIVSDSDNYNRPIESSVRELCAKSGATQHLGRSGGIFILRENEISSELRAAIKNRASFFIDFANDIRPRQKDRKSISEEIATPQKTALIPTSDELLRTQYGYFIRDGYVVDKSKKAPAPYSFILTGRRFSAVVTQHSLGYSFYDNARERRICSFFGDSRSLDSGERVFAVVGDKKYDLCAMSGRVVYQKGSAMYFGDINGNAYSVTVTIPQKYPIKLIRVRYEKNGLDTRFELRPVMSDGISAERGIEVKPFSAGESSCIMFRNTFGMTFPEGIGYAGVCGGEVQAESCALSCNDSDIIFFLGACTSEGGAVKTASRVNRGFFDASLESAVSFASSFLPDIKISTKSRAVDVMMNFFLPYQVAACRFFARGSFYQSGGAYGFRDQLQDSLALVYSMPQTVRVHLLRCCAHQYLDGSVMHWWHTKRFGRVNRGIKSKCSDDLLYLPFVTADYIEKTGDIDLLDVEVNYITSPPLAQLNERYEQPELSETKESVYHHCLRALKCAEQRRGKNGLLLIGSCDWNDAFSLVGEKGRGESVFSTLLFIIVAERFIPIMRSRGDNETADFYEKTVFELRNTVEEKAYFGDRYARAICDDGTVLGIDGCEECEIDILSQAFAALAGLDGERTKKALSIAFSKLYDGKNRIFKLFSPPFSNGRARVGYIRGYVSGIRENGGQYTHGALWGALGFIAAGMNEEALLTLECVNPASRAQDKELAKKYKNEPYAVSADIYSGDFAGRGGWSWYTGAAAWYYRIMLEHVLGIKLGAHGVLLSVKPIIAFEADILLGKSRMHITASEGFTEPKLNGESVLFPISLPEGDNKLEIPLN